MLPTARASDWQTASAPAKPPRLPPFGFELVTKKLMLGAGVAFCCANAWLPIDNTAIVAAASNLVFMLGLLMGCGVVCDYKCTRLPIANVFRCGNCLPGLRP